MKVPLLDLKAQYQKIRDEVWQAIQEVLESQRFILGPWVHELETWMAGYIGVPDAVGVASGTDALLLSLMALEIGPQDAVITTPFTFFATVGSIVRLGALPVFVDIDPKTFNLSPQALQTLIETRMEFDGNVLTYRGRKVRAIVPVHLFGQSAAMAPILEIAKTYHMAVIEDAAQAIGAEYQGKKVGSLGDFGAFSFFPSKNLGGYGDGGMITVRNSEMAERLRALRVHGAKQKYFHDWVGTNSRLDSIQAAVLLVKTRYLDTWNRQRAEVAARYHRLFQQTPLVEAGIVQLPEQSPDSTRHVWNQYTLRVRNRNELRSYLTEQGIGTAIYYPLSLHLQKCFADLGYQEGDFPEAEKAQQEVLSIPMYPELTEEQQVYVVQAIEQFYRLQGIV